MFKKTIFKKTCILIIALIFSFGTSIVNAEELFNFMGKIPTPEELIGALSLPEKSTVRTRGIRLNLSGKAVPPKATETIKGSKPQSAPRVALDIKFEYDSDTLTKRAQRTLQSLGTALNSPKLKNSIFVLEGHTDSIGTEAYNMDLSRRRALAAEKYLHTACKVTNAKFIVKGYGESRPLVKNNPESSDNRRVEVVNVAE